MPSRNRICMHCSFLYWTNSGETSSIWSINISSGFVLLLSVCNSSLHKNSHDRRRKWKNERKKERYVQNIHGTETKFEMFEWKPFGYNRHQRKLLMSKSISFFSFFCFHALLLALSLSPPLAQKSVDFFPSCFSFIHHQHGLDRQQFVLFFTPPSSGVHLIWSVLTAYSESDLPIWIEFCVSRLPDRCKSTAQFLYIAM